MARADAEHAVGWGCTIGCGHRVKAPGFLRLSIGAYQKIGTCVFSTWWRKRCSIVKSTPAGGGGWRRWGRGIMLVRGDTMLWRRIAMIVSISGLVLLLVGCAGFAAALHQDLLPAFRWDMHIATRHIL